MRLFQLFLAVLLVGCGPNPANENSKLAEEIAKNTIIADLHIDVPYRLNMEWVDIGDSIPSRDFDYPRAVSGGLNAPFMSIYTPAELEETGESKNEADRIIDLVERLVEKHPDKFAIATSWADIEAHFEQGLISLPLGMENGSPIEGKLESLDHFYNRGIRYITLAHSLSNHIADSSYDENQPAEGLTSFGESVVQRMNELGIMIDVSHVSDEAFYDVLALSSAPVIASHSSARHFTPGFERNMSGEMITAIAQQGGVVFVNFGSAFLTEDANAYSIARKNALDAFLASHNVSEDSTEAEAFIKQYALDHPYPFATLDDVLDHIDYIDALVGTDHIGIGSDYDGVGDTLPTGLKDVSTYPALIEALLARGYSREGIEKILYGNLKRVWLAVESIAEENS